MTYLKRLYEGPEKYPYGVALSEQLDQPGRSEKLQKAHVDSVDRLGQAVKESMAREERRKTVRKRERQTEGTGRIKTQMAKINTTGLK